MRYRIFAIGVAFVMLVTAASATAPIVSDDVTDYGRNPWRTHYTPLEPEFPLYNGVGPIWEVPLGISRSQPLVVSRDYNRDGAAEVRIFHIAGDTIWALNGDMTPPARPSWMSAAAYQEQLRSQGFILWSTPSTSLCGDPALLAKDDLLRQKCALLGNRPEARPFSSSQAAFRRGATPDDDVLYVGFGHPAAVAAIRAKDGKVLGAFIVDQDGDRGIVAAPLPFEGDTVVIGTTSGEAYIVRGLTTGVASARGISIGGRISSSPIPVGQHSFIIGSDARWLDGVGSHGYLMALGLGEPPFNLNPFRPTWAAAVVTQAGIPGEVAVDDRTVYMADKHGKLYALSVETGQLFWCRQFPAMGPCTGGQGAPGFINNGPGVDDERVYFVFRNDAGPNVGNGRIVALDKATGALVWQQNLPKGKGNTAPVPLNNIVIVGDTGGWVSAFDKRTGSPINFGGYPLQMTDIPYREGDQGERWWEPIGGTATQMTVSNGLMLVGVNSQVEEETVLKAFRLYRLPDLYLRYLDTPGSAETDGFVARVQPACTGCDTVITTTLKVTIGGVSQRPVTVTFGPGIEPPAFTFQSGPQVAGTTVSVVATIDPDNLIAESNKDNNTLRSSVWILDTACCNPPGSRWGSKLTD